MAKIIKIGPRRCASENGREDRRKLVFYGVFRRICEARILPKTSQNNNEPAATFRVFDGIETAWEIGCGLVVGELKNLQISWLKMRRRAFRQFTFIC
jgi:hypothetical protein